MSNNTVLLILLFSAVFTLAAWLGGVKGEHQTKAHLALRRPPRIRKGEKPE